MALIFLINKITEALDQGNCVIGIFIDFSKAFGTVDHNLLRQKWNYIVFTVELANGSMITYLIDINMLHTMVWSLNRKL